MDERATQRPIAGYLFHIATSRLWSLALAETC
jgi:hypothetical protein